MLVKPNSKKRHAKAAAKDAEKNANQIKVDQPLAREAEGNSVLYQQE